MIGERWRDVCVSHYFITMMTFLYPILEIVTPALLHARLVTQSKHDLQIPNITFWLQQRVQQDLMPRGKAR